MAAVEQIIWTPIPNGIESAPQAGEELEISVCVSPTLSGGATGTLSDFPDFQNWPTTLINASNGAEQIQLTFTNADKSTSITAGVDIDTSVLNSDLWDALFSPPGNVEYTGRDAGEPYTDVPIVSYPSDLVASYLQTSYASLAAQSPTDYPSLSQLATVYSALGYVGPDGITALNDIYGGLADERQGSPTSGIKPKYYNDWDENGNPDWIFAAMRFYHFPPSTVTPARPAIPDIDFHRALTFIGQHRTLQRALGLVLDVSISPDVLVQTFGDIFSTSPTSNLYVSATFQNDDGFGLSNSTPVSPRVQCQTGSGTWEAYASSSQIVGRQLTLADTTSFAVYEIDVDGGALKTTQFADNLKLAQSPQSQDPASQNGPAPDAPSSYAPPSLRSAGLTVAAVNRGEAFFNRLMRNSSLMSGAAKSPPAVPDLTAEDLVTGYVLDVYDDTYGAWNSTAMRNLTYNAGSVSLSATGDEPGLDSPPRHQSEPTGSSAKQLNLPANLIRWTGWSNSAPRPGVPLTDDEAPSGETNPTSWPYGLLTITDFSPTPGSLPRLRFGTKYALRARVVDIAGNLIPMSDGATVGDSSKRVTPVSTFGRHEPVGSPDIYSWKTPLPGESLKRLVIRDIDTSKSSIRAFAPNRIAELFAELHGMFDVTSNGATSLSENAYTTIVDMESQRYPMGSAISLTSSVPFLPDPLSRGGVLNVTLGPLAGNQYPFDFNPASGQNWPNYQPYGLVLVAASGSNPTQSATAYADERELLFALTPGDTVTAQLSSYIDYDDLQTLGMYTWISDHYNGSVPTAFQRAAVAGLTWALTPWTTIELLYAVQKPLLIPKFSGTSAEKVIGETYATLSGDFTYSPKSTGRLDILAAWGEPVDNGPGTGVPQGPGSSDTTLALHESTVFTITTDLDEQNSAGGRLLGRHEFFDLKHRNVVYYGQATSRFTENYQGSTTVTVPTTVGTAVPLRLPDQGNLGLDPGSVTVTHGENTYAENVAFTVDASAGTITFAAPPDGPDRGSQVSVSFLPTVSVDSEPFGLNILSSGRPQSLDIAFIVPVYAWSQQTVAGKQISQRSPSALRVFLNRPWWSSGIAELLGVLISPTSDAGGSAANAVFSSIESQYMSDWGLDPVFSSGSLPSAHPRVTDFTARVQDAGGLTIPETAAVRVDVAGHDVAYDALRDLWYADIEVAIDTAYTPMIRLALARYQPNSVPGVELSPVVLADIMSLEPGRTAVVSKAGSKVSVTIEGQSYSQDGGGSGSGPGYAELVIERRIGSIHDDVVGWEPVTKAIPMNAYTDDGTTYWTAHHVAIPHGGQHRVYVAQYEVLAQEDRPDNEYVSKFKGKGLRLVYQDTIPL